MAVVFKGKYCVNATKLYQLFQLAYNDILKQDVLLRKPPIDRKPAYFLVSSFNDVTDKIKEIENNVRTKIKNELFDAADFEPITDTFTETKRKTIKTLNLNKGNEEILKALKRYNQIAVSTEYREIEIAEEEIVLQPRANEETEKNQEQQNTVKEKAETLFDKWNIILSVIAAILLVTVIFIIIHKNI